MQVGQTTPPGVKAVRSRADERWVRLLHVLTAALVAAPLVLVAGTAQGEEAAPHPVAPQLQEVDLVPVAQSATTGGTTGATGSEVLQSPVTAVQVPVVVVGLTWDGTGTAAVGAELRQHDASGWGAWTPVEVEASEEDGRGGTEPFVVTGADQVQGRLTAAPGDLPSGVRLVVVDPGSSAADATAATTSAATTSAATTSAAGPAEGTVSAAAVPAPSVTSRAAWGADESLRSGSPSYATVRAAVVHHTAGSNTYSAAEVPAVLRGIYAFHTGARGWSDVGYNLLADRYGRLWEGRYGGLSRGVVGAHVAGYNTGSFGISVMGTFESAAPPAATQEAVAQALAWRLGLDGVSATATTTLAGRTVPAVVAHRDLGQTACPGQAFYDRMGAIRTRARAIQVEGAGSTAPAPTPTPTPAPAPAAPVPAAPIARDLDGDGTPDVLSRVAGRVSLSARVPAPVQPATTIGARWSAVDQLVGSTDLTGDGRPDLLARNGVTGQLAVYAGNGRGGFSGVLPLGRGWGRVRHIVAPGDVTGDRLGDVLAVASDGGLWLYPGLSGGRLDAGRAVGRGWGSMTSITAGRDLTGDGRNDLLAVDRTGALLVYPGNGKGGSTLPVVLDAAWGGVPVLGVGDWDRDGRADVMGVGEDGRITTRFGAVSGTGPVLDQALRWGNGWDGVRALAAPGDWDGDGRADLVAISRADSSLVLYRGTGARDFASPRTLAIPSATPADTVLVVGDLDGDRRPELVTRTTGGDLLLTRGAAGGAVGATRQIGARWGAMDLLAAAGDVSGDGVPDLLARNRAVGKLYLFRLSKAGDVVETIELGAGWNGMDLLVGTGPWDDDPWTDVLVRRASDNALLLYSGTSTGRLAGPRQVGTRWGALTAVVGIGDHDGDGAADLLVRGPGGDQVFLGDGTGGFGATITVLGLPQGAVLS
jgi:hypothetical protein